jgi:hypothetical protein
LPGAAGVGGPDENGRVRWILILGLYPDPAVHILLEENENDPMDLVQFADKRKVAITLDSNNDDNENRNDPRNNEQQKEG